MSLFIKLLIALIIAGTAGGGYYAYTQYQEKHSIEKNQKLPNRINEGTLTKGIY